MVSLSLLCRQQAFGSRKTIVCFCLIPVGLDGLGKGLCKLEP